MITSDLDTVKTILKNQLGGKWNTGIGGGWINRIAFSDDSFILPTIDEVRLFLQHVKIHLAGSGQANDCDKYAKLLLAKAIEWVDNNQQVDRFWCFGMAWGKFAWINPGELHSCNFFVDGNYDVYWIEPQTNNIYDLSDCVGGLIFLLL